jgi:hypothetical protein
VRRAGARCGPCGPATALRRGSLTVSSAVLPARGS